MTLTYTLIEKITVGAAGAATVTFTSIPQTYTDLKIVTSTRDTYAAVSTAIYLEFNGNSSGYSMRRLRGSGSAADSYSDSSQSTINLYNIKPGSSATASTFGNLEIYIPNYTGSNNKSVSVDGVGENNATEAYAVLFAGLWGNTSAITSIKLYSETLFSQYSTFYLYGIAKEGVTPTPSSAPYATGGDSILFDGTYWIHTFTSSGTFTPKKGLTCDYLVVAGGGGGGSGWSGGGGAGGLRSTVTATGGGGSLESALSLTANTGYTVTVGAGGAASGSNTSGGIGGNSVFSTITSSGGGTGGGGNQGGGNGGSGGGAGSGGATGSATLGGTGTANQGYAGGNSASTTNYGPGGGGGAGAVGQTGTTTIAGNGGNGVATSISGSSVTYAGGGGGGGISIGITTPGTGGTGGGGNGANSTTTGFAGTANRGGGGGGGGYSGGWLAGGAGGSGIVIVRYAA